MKILQINKYYYPIIGGIETTVKQYAEHFSKIGKEVTVLTIKQKFSLKTDFEVLNGVNVIRCRSLGTYFSMPVSLSFLYYFFKIRKNFDIIHFHEPFPLGSLLSFILPHDKKVVITWHSDIIKQKFLKKIFEIFQKFLCNRADIITTTSPNMVLFSSILKRYSKKIIILPLSLNPKNYKRIDKKNIKLPILPKKYALFLGRLAYYKGINILIDSIREINLRNFNIIIAGDGPLAPFIKDKINDNRSVLFINKFLTEDEKKFLMKNCLFFLFPSVLPSEAYGITQIEAMIYGKPIINTNLKTGVPWVSLHGVTGLTIKVSNAHELAEAINILISDSRKRMIYGKNAKKRVEVVFSEKVILKQLENIYFNLLKS